MHDLAEHKEMEAASHHDLGSGKITETAPSQEEIEPKQAEDTAPQSTSEIEEVMVQPLSHKAEPQEKILPTDSSIDEVLPQELNADELEMVDGDLVNMKKDIDGLDLQSQKAPVTGPIDAASFAREVSEAEKLNVQINSLKNNTWLHVFIIILCVAVLVGLAATVATQLI
jgi:hypothetical protein